MPGPAPWDNFPPTTAITTREVPWIHQAYYAVLEREWCQGRLRWPRGNVIWGPGLGDTVTSITETTITCSGADWSGSGDNPWLPGASTGLEIPESYDAIIEIDPLDPIKIIHLEVQTKDSTTQITVNGLRDYLTSNIIGNYSDLVGKQLYFIKRNGLWPLERWPAWAQAQEYSKGSVVSSTLETLTDENQRWEDNYFTDHDLITKDEDGLMQRIPITGNDMHTLEFDEVDSLPSSNYAIILADKVYKLGKEVHQPWRWYSGARDFFWCHFPENLDRSMFPAPTVTWAEWNGFSCENVIHGPALDQDMWSDLNGECGGWEAADKCYSPHLFKTWRAIQSYLEDKSIEWIEAKEYDNQPGVPLMLPAIAFRAAGINAYTTTISAVDEDDGLVTVPSLDLPYTPIVLHYAIHVYDNNGNISEEAHGGTCTATNDTTLVISGLVEDDVLGKTIDLSLGWTRFCPRLFAHMFPRTCFIPDQDAGVVDPAEIINWSESGSLGVGMWIHRTPSTTYRPESGKILGTGDSFIAGDLARWVSTGWNDAVDGPNAGATSLDPLIPYYDHFYDGIHVPTIQSNRIDNQLDGFASNYVVAENIVAVASSTYRIHDSGKSWYATTWHNTGNDGYGHLESGVATAGSTTSFSDSSKVVGSESGAWWEADRFSDFTGSYVGFIIEFLLPTEVQVTDPETGIVTTETQDAWHARPLATTDISSGVSGTWVEALPSNPNGKQWRIREPHYELNRWQGRMVKVTHAADGETEIGWVKYCDDKTLYLETPLSDPVVAGDRYEIVNPKAGGVWQRSTTPPEDNRPYIRQGAFQYWMAPRGTDQERTAVPNSPQPFHINQTENEPTHVKRYGRIEKNDQIRHYALYDEIARFLNELRWTKGAAIWLDGFEKTGEAQIVPAAEWYICDSPDTFDPPLTRIHAEFAYEIATSYETTFYGMISFIDGPGDVTWQGSQYYWSEATETPVADGTRPYAISDSPSDESYHSDVYCECDAFDIEARDRKTSVWAKGQTTKPTILAAAVDFMNLGHLDTANGESLYQDTSSVDFPGPFNDDCPSGTQITTETVQEFKNGGVEVAFHLWKKWDTYGASTTATITTTDTLGSDATPPPHHEPSTFYEPGRGQFEAGWQVISELAIYRWDVTGGLEMLLD